MIDYRIEAATKEEWAERALRAEAKLAKAIDALEWIGSGKFEGRVLVSLPPLTLLDKASYLARTTLANLKGNVNE